MRIPICFCTALGLGVHKQKLMCMNASGALGMTPEHLIHLCTAAGANARTITTTSRSADESLVRMAHDMGKQVSTLDT